MICIIVILLSEIFIGTDIYLIELFEILKVSKISDLNKSSEYVFIVQCLKDMTLYAHDWQFSLF